MRREEQEGSSKQRKRNKVKQKLGQSEEAKEMTEVMESQQDRKMNSSETDHDSRGAPANE